jgi:hypothetical protein
MNRQETDAARQIIEDAINTVISTATHAINSGLVNAEEAAQIASFAREAEYNLRKEIPVEDFDLFDPKHLS